jgi:hypothetical protein
MTTEGYILCITYIFFKAHRIKAFIPDLPKIWFNELRNTTAAKRRIPHQSDLGVFIGTVYFLVRKKLSYLKST